MTYYPGGKKKIGKDIANIIYEVSIDIEIEDNLKIKGYCEPFCGMLGVYQHIPELFIDHNKLKYDAGDRNPYLIKLWKGLQNGFNPPTKCTKKEYYKYKDTDNTSLKSIFIGFACAIRGVFRSTYLDRNIVKQAQHSKEIGKILKNVNFKTGDYNIFSNLKGYIIYCDPPYKNTGTPYSVGDVYDTIFDYNKFIKWCEVMSEDNIVFISEYKKPCKDCCMLWKKGKEKLYLL